ncbi:MAG: hypothetical protein AB2724_10710 [Candidatus Thiodiazotropha sp.]
MPTIGALDFEKKLFKSRVFLLFLRRRDLKSYLREKRQALEKELARMVRIANRLSHH